MMPSTFASSAATADDFTGTYLALIKRLEVDVDAATVGRRVGAVHADE